MAQPAAQAAVTAFQMVAVPILDGDIGTGVISWCEALDRSQVQFQWTMAQTASVAVSRAGSKVSSWIRAQRMSGTTYDVWGTQTQASERPLLNVLDPQSQHSS